ncbi:MAG: hypothetical protein Q8P67_07865, partial [archaeon]|nr:hypothetical protein [archaeon]
MMSGTESDALLRGLAGFQLASSRQGRVMGDSFSLTPASHTRSHADGSLLRPASFLSHNYARASALPFPEHSSGDDSLLDGQVALILASPAPHALPMRSRPQPTPPALADDLYFMVPLQTTF